MLKVGDFVRLRSPFNIGNEDAVFVVDAVQFVAEDGTISELPTQQVQYLISGGSFEGVAYSAENLEIV